MTVSDAAFMPELPALICNDEWHTDYPNSLEQLEAVVQRDLDLVRYPARTWVLPKIAPHGEVAHDAIIVGGGQSGLATAFGLMRQRVGRILVIDENPVGREGPWDTYARMLTLRTDKYVGGMELGLPALSLRSWFEAKYGRAAWNAMDKLPRKMQCDYLAWYRRVLDLPTRNECRLTSFHPAQNGLIEVTMESAGTSNTLWCRKLIFATGIEGNGTRNLLPCIAALPKSVLGAHRRCDRLRAIGRQARRGSGWRSLSFRQRRGRRGSRSVERPSLPPPYRTQPLKPHILGSIQRFPRPLSRSAE